MGNSSTYIAGTGTITAVGIDSPMNYLSVKAGINSYQLVDSYSEVGGALAEISMAKIPNEALPPLNDELGKSGEISFRYDRILRMCHVAAVQAMVNYTDEKLIPLIYASPSNDIIVSDSFPSKFISYFIKQTGLPIDPKSSRVVCTGRTGVIEALKIAQEYLEEKNFEYVLIGSGDSFQNQELITALAKKYRIHGPGVIDGFAPGEGAGFILCTKNYAKALKTNNYILSLLKPGLANEPGHWYSDEPYKGEGLSKAYKLALAERKNSIPIDGIYSSMNGENYWVKEYGVAMIRNKDSFTDNCKLHYPVDCYGDLGSATGAVLINLAVESILDEKSSNTQFIYCSSDNVYRAAVCLEPVPLNRVSKEHKNAIKKISVEN